MTALRVLVCDDSLTYAAALRRMLEYDLDITVPAVCTTAEEAIAAVPRIEPDLVTMDVELPGMGGIEAVGEIMSSRPLPILVLSGYVGPGTEKAAAALAAGALDVLAKDDLDLLDPAGAAGAAPGGVAAAAAAAAASAAACSSASRLACSSASRRARASASSRAFSSAS